MNKIKVLLVKPNEEPKIIEIENTEDSFKDIISGELEYIKLEQNVKLICNKNGKQQNLEFNRVIENDVVVGTFLVVGYKKGVITSLEDIDKQMRYFNLKNDDGMIEFCRKYIGKSSNLIEDKLNLKGIGHNRGFITLSEEKDVVESSDLEIEKLYFKIKNECVTRLKLLKLYLYASDFDNGIINISYVDKNVLHQIDKNEQQIVNNLQQYRNIMIYHIIRLDNNVTYYLYVGRNREKWREEKMNLLDGYLEAICIKPEDRIIGVETANWIITKVV